MDEALNKLAAYLGDRLGAEARRMPRWRSASSPSTVEPRRFVEVDRSSCATIRLCRFGCLIDICGVDYPEREQRFDVVYHLLSPWLNHRIRVRDQDRRGARRCRASSGCSRPPTGSSARPTTSTASCSPATPTSGACSPITAFRAIPCARTFRSPASSSFATTTS